MTLPVTLNVRSRQVKMRLIGAILGVLAGFPMREATGKRALNAGRYLEPLSRGRTIAPSTVADRLLDL